ncbi:type II toxin-antitoxin system HicA family toxin [Niabella aquatica]
MTKKRKLADRILSIPSDFTWDELTGLLSFYGYDEVRKGKTAGSRKKFVDADGNVILLHKPHPSNIVKKYAIRQVVEYLTEKGKIRND